MGAVTALVLSGGASRRMDGDKRALRLFPLSPRFLERTVVLGRLSADRVLVAGRSDGLIGVEVLEDRWPGEGPLGGLITAMLAFPDDRLVVLACDYPMLQAELVGRLLHGLDGHDASVAVEHDGVRRHPLVAAYDARRCGGVAAVMFADGHRSMRALVDRISVRTVGPSGMGDDEAHALSLYNVNTREELHAVRRRSLELDRRAT